jgi:hypothetical protein
LLKIRDGGSVQRRACDLALAIGMDREREVRGMWLQANEGAKFWMEVLTDLKQRGVSDIVIACVDGLNGFCEAIEAVFPATTVQTCIMHLIRHRSGSAVWFVGLTGPWCQGLRRRPGRAGTSHTVRTASGLRRLAAFRLAAFALLGLTWVAPPITARPIQPSQLDAYLRK